MTVESKAVVYVVEVANEQKNGGNSCSRAALTRIAVNH